MTKISAHSLTTTTRSSQAMHPSSKILS
jgi:hypothetical protein